jgi:hypothetical protein
MPTGIVSKFIHVGIGLVVGPGPFLKAIIIDQNGTTIALGNVFPAVFEMPDMGFA